MSGQSFDESMESHTRPEPAYDGSMTSEQLERAAAIAESRGVDLETAQELVYLRDRVVAIPQSFEEAQLQKLYEDPHPGYDCAGTCVIHSGRFTAAHPARPKRDDRVTAACLDARAMGYLEGLREAERMSCMTGAIRERIKLAEAEAGKIIAKGWDR